MSEQNSPAVAGPVDAVVGPRTPQGVVAVLLGPDGRDLANASSFCRSGPAGFSAREFQEIQARRALSLAAVSALASPTMANALDSYLAEKIISAMCDHGCRVVVLPVGHDQ